MDKLNSFIRHQPSYRLIIVGILLFLLHILWAAIHRNYPRHHRYGDLDRFTRKGSWKILRRKASRHKATLVDKSMRTLGTL